MNKFTNSISTSNKLQQSGDGKRWLLHWFLIFVLMESGPNFLGRKCTIPPGGRGDNQHIDKSDCAMLYVIASRAFLESLDLHARYDAKTIMHR